MSTTKWTAPRIAATKGRQRIATMTAYDYATARLVDEAGLPLILVGDSLGMTVLGLSNTLPVTMEQMLHHTAAVSRAVSRAMVVGDMPFLSYQGPIPDAVINAGRFLKEAGADAVKIEGGAFRAPLIRVLVENGIPVLGHIGLTPQSVHTMGGFKVQGKTALQADQLIEDARELEKAGVFAIVLEGMPAALGKQITEAVSVPTIGIGAGPDCDGQILVFHDAMGLTQGSVPKFAKAYADLSGAIRGGLAQFRTEVESGAFPSPDHCY